MSMSITSITSAPVLLVSNASKTAIACQGLPNLIDEYLIREVDPAVLCIIHQQKKSTDGRYQKLSLSKSKIVCTPSEARIGQ